MVLIKLKENESFEVALRKFKRNVEKSGLLIELKLRESYEKPTTKRKRKLLLAKKRHFRKIKSQKLPKKLY